ncbi:hypothetical protein A3B21_00170 [Candidatus Uhrbacteria bacterium RIFCSPLOWO2_01_FULL_47_24]|uniref:BioF2-like acetyltransferase domain-containing protein n=1 Tax=Candidatus Uhrbacteria bacterium RIFCSPLOWO2_01_FULL_47_24 TaxID=1802401 RepID=A0A1F7USU3_9BACT|nr:MAG: hypothetical protein A2753_02270 [Candidatus Uhrbacteria bacterium RIFCSPHIGHO2_01_FULL_47_11]OGL68012.1 MAG: hypothetical protein A3D58_01545 [Candidatus Uhrbacteria bacterium RIFCSPHIGHO2_02_FULL_46_47]OGL75423.1 MAG: hypothetical protein A3F52_04885 [Candidatus Uhrbacteria bacterium RIFCSPHIGHO2_12_FULL_47_11]OGL81326.1 MAG: hypothetical protein A3B21_00170 [Candidatus Uhrbacteria bacterium RIFCSPLOWO2_01_FULL_47_24]OGL83930.1 MAG: hypothetical protein A3J03_00735 [Candidatus Uhrbact
MLTMETRNFLQEEWNAIVLQFEDLNFMQLWEYGEAKRITQGWQVFRHLFRAQGKIVGAAQALVKTLPFTRRGLVWINRAPLAKLYSAPYSDLLQEMSRTLKRYWVDERRMYLRIVPTLSDSVSSLQLMEECGLQSIPNSQWISVRVDLTKDVDDLREQLSQNWRRGLKKAEEAGLSYEVGSSENFVQRLNEEYQVFLQRKRFKTNFTPHFIHTLQKLLPVELKMYIIRGYKEKQSQGSILFGCYGHTAEFLAETLNENGRRSNAGRLLFWNALLGLKQRGFLLLDLGGVHPKETPEGILRFKSGFRGTPYQLVGTFEAAHGTLAHLTKMIVAHLA